MLLALNTLEEEVEAEEEQDTKAEVNLDLNAHVVANGDTKRRIVDPGSMPMVLYSKKESLRLPMTLISQEEHQVLKHLDPVRTKERMQLKLRKRKKGSERSFNLN